MSEFVHALRELATPVLATAAAMLLIVVVVAVARRLGVVGPLDPIDLLEKTVLSRGIPGARLSVNVEYRDATGAIMDVGPFIQGSIRNGRGRTVELDGGRFHGCDRKIIKAGGTVEVSLQDGRVRERLVVQLDYHRECLFVQSRFELAKAIEMINGGPTSACGHQPASTSLSQSGSP